jgi:hypothetical protein
MSEKARTNTIEHMKSNVTCEQYRAKWIPHWNEINIPHLADVMVVWLREAGLCAETIFRSYEVALISAHHP